MDKRQQDYEKQFNEWANSLTPAERAELKARGVDKPARDDEHSKHGSAANGQGMSFSSKSSRMEPDAYRLACLADNSQNIELIVNKNPFSDLCEKDIAAVELREAEEMKVKVEAVAGCLSYFFAPKCGKEPTPFDVLQRLYALTYTVRPSLIDGWSLEKIAACFNKSRQALSKEVLKLQNYGMIARTAKSAQAVSKYAENTTLWHQERKAAERRQKRLEYLRQYAAQRREERNKAAKEYYAANKERLLAEQRAKRAAKQVKAVS